MDTVWIDTMFPGIDVDEGWEENMKRVVNYDYLLKEYLDWQLKHLSADNFNPTDWSNIQEEIISMTAGQIDLTAYYTKDETDELYASLQLYADEQVASLSLAAVSSGGTAQLVLQSGGTTIPGSGATLALSVTNNQNGYSTLALTADGAILATSGQITLGGKVVFQGNDISLLNNNSGYQTSSGVTTIIGNTVTTGYINALDVTAKTVKASASISSPRINGGVIVGSLFYSPGEDSYFLMGSDGWSLSQKTGASWYTRASLYTTSNSATLSLGNSTPAVLEKYYDNGHYLWLGNSSRTHGLRINLSTGAYDFL